MRKPTRTCVACRNKQEKNNLIRITHFDNNLIIDQKKAYPNRAIYVCKDENCISLLRKNKAIERFLKVETNDEFFNKLKEFAKREK